MDYLIGAYWASGPVDLLNAAATLQKFIGSCKNVLSEQVDFIDIHSQKSLDSVFGNEPKSLFHGNIAEDDSGPIDELGFNFHFWNNDKLSSFVISGNLGATSSPVKFPNLIIIETENFKISKTEARSLMDLLVNFYSPAYAVVHNEETEMAALSAHPGVPLYKVEGLYNYVV